jgi:hypothetical protein
MRILNTVYKFCGNHGVNVLENLELKITPPNQFNDPFEFTPRIDYSDEAAYAKTQEQAILEADYERQCAIGAFKESIGRYAELHPARLAEMKRQFMRNMPRGAAEAAAALLDGVSERYGILCMSGQRTSILMWGHYCDKPLGLTIGFNRTSPIFRLEKGLRPVNYVPEITRFKVA